jgi:arabinofuranosyltransferase
MDTVRWTRRGAAPGRDACSRPDPWIDLGADERRLKRISFAKSDWISVVGLVVVATLFIRWRGNLSLSPWEDAAMLLRYSENLAAGHGIVWNVGEPPVDGATDFLFMLLVAFARRLGAELIQACHVVGLAFHLVTIPVAYWAVRCIARGPVPWLS